MGGGEHTLTNYSKQSVWLTSHLAVCCTTPWEVLEPERHITGKEKVILALWRAIPHLNRYVLHILSNFYIFLPTHPDPGPLTYGSILNILMGNTRPLFHIQKESPMGNKDLVCFSFSYISWSNKKYCLCWTCSTYILRALQLLIAQWLQHDTSE